MKLSEQFLNSLIDSQTNFLIRLDINGAYTFVNKQYLKKFGFKSEEIIGNNFKVTVLPEEYELCDTAFYNTVSQPGKVIHLTHKKLDSAGKLHDTEWELIALTDENGEVSVIQGVGHDITDKTDAEKEIILAKNSLEALINNTEDLIWSVDREFTYQYMNQAYMKTIEAHSGMMPQKGDSSLHKVFDVAVLEQWKNHYERAFKGERFIVLDENNDQASGQKFYYETSFNPIANAGGDITGIGCFARDITERIRANRAIIEQNERLQNIASLSSHELRRPVATMLGLINIFDKENFFNPDNKEIIEHLLKVSIEIDDVIHQIVDKAFTLDFFK